MQATVFDPPQFPARYPGSMLFPVPLLIPLVHFFTVGGVLAQPDRCYDAGMRKFLLATLLVMVVAAPAFAATKHHHHHHHHHHRAA